MNTVEQNFRRSIGKKIKLARKKSKYTQEQLAEKLSLSSRYISQLERGIAFGSASTIINICKTLNISSDFLFKDLIRGESANTDFIDQAFLEDYIKLDSYSKTIVKVFAHELVKVQNENKKMTL